MTDQEKSIWRGAYDLFDWNRDMPNTDQSWRGFITSLTAYANKYDWRECPLSHRLADAVLLAVEDEVKKRIKAEEEAARQLSQMSFFEEAYP